MSLLDVVTKVRWENGLTSQEIFDAVVEGLHAQGRASVKARFDEDEEDENMRACSYRGDNGLKCAVGMLIPDDMYQDRMEGDPGSGENVDGLIRAKLLPWALVPHRDLLNDLQLAHDNYLYYNQGVFDRWLWNKLCEVATKYSLDSRRIDELANT
jgi:hypothetical protein